MVLTAIRLLDVHFPTTDGHELIFTRYTEPQTDQHLLLAKLGWALPAQAPPHLTAAKNSRRNIVQTFGSSLMQNQSFALAHRPQLRKIG